jgi:hypothetical protein
MRHTPSKHIISKNELSVKMWNLLVLNKWISTHQHILMTKVCFQSTPVYEVFYIAEV